MRLFSAAVLFALIAPAAALADTPIQPGLWETRTVVTDVDMPGAPPQMLQIMKKPRSMRHCITPEQAANGPKELLKQSGGECKFTKYAVAGGRMDAVMQCNAEGRGAMTATTQGSYTPTSYSTVNKMVMAGPQGKMSIASTGTGKRVGPCK